MFNKDILLRYSPQKNLKLNYKINYRVIGERSSLNILESTLDISTSYKVMENDNEKIKSEYYLDDIIFKSNNKEKGVSYKGDRLFLTLNQKNEVLERKSNIPSGIIEYISFVFPENKISMDEKFDGTFYVLFPNINRLIDVKGNITFEKFEGFKGYNCARLAFNFYPKILKLTDSYEQTLYGNGYMLYDINFSILTFMTMNAFSDTGEVGLTFKSHFTKELVPVKSPETKISSEIMSTSDEYFIRY